MKKIFFYSIQLFLFFLLLTALVSCDTVRKYQQKEREEISNYLNNHPTDTFKLQLSGLYYRQVLLGTGASIAIGDTACVYYTGRLLDLTPFETNVGGKMYKFPVGIGAVLPGFDEGTYYMKQGGKSQFLMPSNLAFGSQGYYSIGGYTPLLYDVELVQVIPGPTK
jgi:FKBP-type peptidyl-prolyl cis-trans isomerase FkpA